jgi:large subunit ribosomal protein L22
MEASATVKYVRISPQKARLVIDLIRGKKAAEALNILGYAKAERTGIKRLGFTKKRAAYDIAKVLFSAIANAEQKSDAVDVDELVVKKAYVNEGPRMKRIRPAPMGRAYRYQRKMSHITVVVEQPEG